MAVLDYIPKYVRMEVRMAPETGPDEFVVRFWTESKSDGEPVAVWFDVVANEFATATPAAWTSFLLEELETAWVDQDFAWTF